MTVSNIVKVGQIKGMLKALKLVESQIIPKDFAMQDEYRRGQYRGAMSAANVIRRSLKNEILKLLNKE